jgi:hypothetical protein
MTLLSNGTFQAGSQICDHPECRHGLAVKQLHAYARVSRKISLGIDVSNSTGKSAANRQCARDLFWYFYQDFHDFVNGHGQTGSEANARR